MLFAFDGTNSLLQFIDHLLHKTDTHTIGKVSSVYSIKNQRKYMEDFYIRQENDIGIYAIFDGHGGSDSAIYARNFFNKSITKYIHHHRRDTFNFSNALENFIIEVETKLNSRKISKKKKNSGTTCLIVIIEKTKITVANVGDCRAVLGGNKGVVFDETVDHKPRTNPIEKKRIEAAGGFLKDVHINDRVLRDVYVNGFLQMSKSVGDYNIKNAINNSNIINAIPDIKVWNLEKYRPDFLILASDGVWDVMLSKWAVRLVRDWYKKDNDFAAKRLADRAMAKRSKDNITIIIVVFQNGYYQIGEYSSN